MLRIATLLAAGAARKQTLSPPSLIGAGRVARPGGSFRSPPSAGAPWAASALPWPGAQDPGLFITL